MYHKYVFKKGMVIENVQEIDSIIYSRGVFRSNIMVNSGFG